MIRRPATSTQSRSSAASDVYKRQWYDGEQDCPHVVKEPGPANESPLFELTARKVSARIALAHIRRSSGTSSVLTNTHPFVAGRWAFCHNGHCSRERLMEHLLPCL